MPLNNKPKVGIFTKPIDQGTSGSGSHLRQLVNRILDINDRFNIILIHHSKNNKEIYKRTDELIISKNPIIASSKLRKEKFDILHFSPLTILSPVWLKKPKKIATIHGGGAYELYFARKYNIIKRLHAKTIRPYYARKLEYIFTVSRITKRQIINYYRVNKDKIYLTYNAVDDDFKVYNKKPIELKKKYGIDSPFIFHLSRYSMRKNPWTLLKAFQILKKQENSIKLVLGGSGWKNKEVIEFTRQQNLLNDIVFPGFIPRRDVIGLLNLAEVFVFPSFFEGFGMPNLEAMACGCPVITSNAFAIPEIVGDAALILKNNSDHVELANKMIEVLENDKLRNILIKKGLERVKLYSWEESAQTVLNIYDKCLKQ
ncbi:MAG: glycosyltransferase family 4 protein [Candidatus Hodarchaeota archaeon]